MGDVAFHTATTVDEALSLVGDGSNVKVVAGGSDLIVQARGGRELPGNVVAIHRIDALRSLDASGDLTLGALVTHADIVASDAIRSTWTALADASAIVGSHATRNVGTIGGNVMNASPAADNPPVLLAYGASLHLASASGRRVVEYAQFHCGYRRTVARADELVVAVELPRPPRTATVWYRKVGTRRAQAISKVALAACLHWDGPRIARARFGFASLAPVPALALALARAVEGQAPQALDRSVLARALAEDFQPIDDVRSTAVYRRQVALNLVLGAIGLA